VFQNSPYKSPDPGPGVGAGFGIGVLVYVCSLVVEFFIVSSAFPHTGFNSMTSANLIAHLVIDGGLIWYSLASKRKGLAQGLIISLALTFLLDSACWKMVR
jgi:hypothetical protein